MVDTTTINKEQNQLICPLTRPEGYQPKESSLNKSEVVQVEMGTQQNLVSAAHRPEGYPFNKDSNNNKDNIRCSNESDSIVFTKKAKKLGEDIFYEQFDTFCEHEGKSYLLFDGTLTIEKKTIVIIELYDQHGCVCEQKERIVFTLVLRVEQMRFKRDVPLEDLFEGGFLTFMSGGISTLGHESKVKKLFKKYMKMKIRGGGYDIETVYEHPGWKKITGIGWCYVLPDGIIGKPNINIYANKTSTYGSSNKVYCGCNIPRDFLSMRSILPEKQEVVVIMQYYMMLALIKSLLREKKIPPQFCLAIIGETNSKKTTLSNLFFKLYDRDMGVDIDFTSTKVAIEECMMKNSDSVTIFDDITPPDSKAGEREMKGKLELLARSFGGNISKKRSKNYVAANPGASEYTPVLSSGVITGEIFPVALLSSRTRIVKVEIGRYDVNLSELTRHQFLDVLPAFVKDFLWFVSDNIEQVINDFCREFNKLRLALEKEFKTSRFAESFSMLACMATMFSHYLQNRGFSYEEASEIAYSDINMLKKILKNNDNEANQRPDETIIAEAIVSELNSLASNEDVLRRAHIRDDYILIHPNYLLEILDKYYMHHGKVFPYTEVNELSKFLESKGLIKTRSEGNTKRRTLKASFTGQNIQARVYYFRRKTVETLAQDGIV